MNEFAIEIKNLTKKFGNFTAVDNINFKIKKGVIFGFLGPNGSGKSTTIRMMCGVLHPTSGDIKIFGLDTQKQTEAVRHNIGYMSQKFSLYEDLTVDENLNFFAQIYGLDSNEVIKRKKELIKMANLSGKENDLAGTLSGGWKQRLSLGCALIHKPSLLILDEPTAGVDPVSRRAFWDIIKQLPALGITILITTHYMDEAEECGIIAFIFNGKLINFGSVKEIYKKEKMNNLEDIFISYVKKLTPEMSVKVDNKWVFLKE